MARQASSFGTQLRDYRRAAGLTQEALAERAGLSRRGLQHLEAGDASPFRGTLEALVQALALGPEERARLQGAARATRPVALRKRTASGPGPATNLPHPLSSFVGREAEVAAVCDRLLQPEVRLLTLTGPGGVGKTRLALQAAAEVMTQPGVFPDGVWFVPLAPVRDPSLVPAALAQVLGVTELGARSVPDVLEDYLRARRLLLVLDNFEQVSGAGPFVAQLLAAAPGTKALVTSRAVLRVAGEHGLSVPPLGLPPLVPPLVTVPRGAAPAHRERGASRPGGAMGVARPVGSARLSQYEAVRLFVERARAAEKGFAVTNETVPAVAEVCHRLDGLPLAIELAAARVRLLPPEALLARLGRRLPLLTGGPRDAPARQRTLRDTVAWSHELLEPAEQPVFRRLAVFAGGCTLDAAEAVCGGAARTGEAVADGLDGLAALMDASLLEPMEVAAGGPETAPAADAVWDGPRFRMLETVSEYALERLEASGEVETVRRRHAEYFVAFAEWGEPELRGDRAPIWLARFERELDNVRAALSWCLQHGEASLGLRLFGKLSAHWYLRGDPDEARRWLDALIALPASGTAAGLVRALNAGVITCVRQSDLDGVRRYAAAALAAARRREDAAGAAFSRAALLLCGQAEDGRPATETDVAGALAEVDAQGDTWLRAVAATFAGFGAARAGQPEAAAGHLAAALEGFRTTGDMWGIAEAAVELGQVALYQDDAVRAAQLFAEGLDAHRALGHRQGMARCLAGAAAAARDHPRQAARLLGAVDALLDDAGVPLGGMLAPEMARHTATVRARLGGAAFAAARREGRQQSIEESVREVDEIARGRPAPAHSGARGGTVGAPCTSSSSTSR
jgi:predicted ATPase/transcriptional regulator with XRE-family HTH domain